MAILGVDLGGTKIAAGLVSAKAEVTHCREVPTLADQGYEVSRGQLDQLIAAMLGPEVEAIGICAPGPLDPISGVVANPPNLPGWRNIALAHETARKYGLPCRVENDANAAALAEARFGAGAGFDPVFYATLSTGIGTGLVSGGKVFHGAHGAAAEGGHVSVDYRSSVVCRCGVRGCIEALASGTAILRRAREAGFSVQNASELAALEDPAAVQLMEETTDMLAAWLGSMMTLFDPGVVVLGGGVTKLGEKLFGPLRRKTPACTLNPNAAGISIVPAALGRECGVVGAAAAFLSF